MGVTVTDPFQREHPDPLAGADPPLVVDRQRIVHSSAFRRLQYKTQVFVALDDDHYRTRLTHSLEVAHLARMLAEALRRAGVPADPELAEVVALGHDLGHPPFGHAGERALDECVRLHTDGREGFEHNAHALRTVEHLEHPYPDFRGLNLTRVVRECMAKHSTAFDRPGTHPLQDGRPPPREGLIADLADRLAYTLHDLQDGLYANLIDPAELAELPLWSDATAPRGDSDALDWRSTLRPTVDRIQTRLIADAVAESCRRAQAPPAATPAGAAGAGVALPAATEAQLDQMNDFLLRRLYRNQRLVRMDSKARRIVRDVFTAYVSEPTLMPPRYASRVAEQGAARVAADYIAGMTDRFCLREHARLFDPAMDV